MTIKEFFAQYQTHPVLFVGKITSMDVSFKYHGFGLRTVECSRTEYKDRSLSPQCSKQ